MTGRNDSEFHNLSSSRIVMEQAVSPTRVTRAPSGTDSKDKLRRFDAPNRLEIITGIIVALFLWGSLGLIPVTGFYSFDHHGFYRGGVVWPGATIWSGWDYVGWTCGGHGDRRYSAAILANKLGVGFWLALPLSALLALVAGLIGLPSLRVSGQHYIIITFCFCALLVIAFTNGGSFTGAATGLDVGSIDPLFGISFDRLKNAYYLVIVALLLCLFAYYLITNSAYGRTLRAIRENEPLARAVSIKTGLHKIGVLMVSGAFAGVAGILQAYYLHHIAPNLYGAFPQSLSRADGHAGRSAASLRTVAGSNHRQFPT